MRYCVGVVLLLQMAVLFGQETADRSAIRETALDYIEGWYAGDTDRMASALHPNLAKRAVLADDRLSDQTAEILLQRTRSGGGTKVPKEQQQKDVVILDLFEGAAVVRIVATDWVDFLQLVKWQGRWVIINVLWEIKPDSYEGLGLKKKVLH